MIKKKWLKSALLIKLVVILTIGTAGTVFAHGGNGGSTSNCSGGYVDHVFIINNNFELQDDGDAVVSGSRDNSKVNLNWEAADGYAITCVKVQGLTNLEYNTYEYDGGALSDTGLQAPKYEYSLWEKVKGKWQWVNYSVDQRIAYVQIYFKELPAPGCTEDYDSSTNIA
ncbi:hypothetical protein [Paenibacillus harenae]|uniref:hypothetical protein n=1 Tax=Paenibacillus harenae TaxID=306543 RepID=UPI002794090D|nr:hypothetical protein [Paenibacillus harenae]MDQ0063649.1 hypothetical protein [Paenibacillus harenae]